MEDKLLLTADKIVDQMLRVETKNSHSHPFPREDKGLCLKGIARVYLSDAP